MPERFEFDEVARVCAGTERMERPDTDELEAGLPDILASPGKSF